MTQNKALESGNETGQILASLVITKIEARKSVGGTWVKGTFPGYRFSALVFAEHAECKSYELKESRISKLWIQRETDDEVVFNWDRGLDIPASYREIDDAINFLCENLAELAYRNP